MALTQTLDLLGDVSVRIIELRFELRDLPLKLNQRAFEVQFVGAGVAAVVGRGHGSDIVTSVEAIDTLHERFPVITLVGTGLVGGSMALGLKAAGYRGHLIGVGRRTATLDVAVQRGCLDEATLDLGSVVARSRLIVLATPLGTFRSLFETIAEHDHADLIISDAGSVKASVCRDAREMLPAYERFVPAHPMAGAEQAGPGAARPDLFKGRPCVTTPDDATAPRVLEDVEALWRGLGMTIIRMSAIEHDRQAAAISHLPHVSSVALTEVAEAWGGLDIASSGFRDTTRLASSTPTMRLDIMMSNREALLKALDTYMLNLTGLRDLLARADDEALKKALESAKRRRDAWMASTGEDRDATCRR